MHERTMWPLLAAAGFLLGLIAMASISLESHSVGAQTGSDEHQVWITDTGFNPPACVIRRNDAVRFVNKTNSVRDVVFTNLTLPQDPNTPLSTGDLQPGEASEKYSFSFAGSNHFYEKYSPSWTGSITTTLSGNPSCTQVTPTPTPTITPTPSPTPSATPTPPRSPACGVQTGCAIAPNVSREE